MQRLLVRLGLAAGAVMLVFVCVLLAVLPSQGEAHAHSVFSFEPAGFRALFLLCESLGLPVEPWSQAPGHLEGRGALLVLARLPDAPPDEPASPPGDDPGRASPRRSRALAHYRRFVEEGGTLLVLDSEKVEPGKADSGKTEPSEAGSGETESGEKDSGEEDSGEADSSNPGADESAARGSDTVERSAGVAALDFLRKTLAIPGLEDLESVPLPEGVDPAIVLVGDERLELGQEARRALGASAPVEVLARAADGSPLALARAVGAGRVALACLPVGWLENDALAKKGEPALLFVRLLERLAPFERVLFDEYALGVWRPVPLEALAFSPRLAWLSVHLLLLFLVLGWRSAWSGPFPRDPESTLAASPLARARGFGRTLARAGRWDLLASLLRRGMLARWDARAGRRRAGEADLEARLGLLARGDEERHARLAELFVARAPGDERELAALEADLCALERELFATAEKRKTARTVGAGRSGNGS